MASEVDQVRNLWAKLGPAVACVIELAPQFQRAVDQCLAAHAIKEDQLNTRDSKTSVALADSEALRAQLKAQAARLSAAIGKLE
jgi:hypothetical protein